MCGCCRRRKELAHLNRGKPRKYRWWTFRFLIFNLLDGPSEDDIACSDRCAVVPLVSLWNLNIVTSPHKFPDFFPSRLRCRCLQPVLAIPRVVQAHESVSKQVVAPELRKHAPSPKVVQVLHRQLRARSQDGVILDGMRRPALQARELASQEVRQRIHAGTPRMPHLASHLPLRCRTRVLLGIEQLQRHLPHPQPCDRGAIPSGARHRGGLAGRRP